ncbi:MAG: aspartate carbamoyltransferase, partial [Bacillota bacterium]
MSLRGKDLLSLREMSQEDMELVLSTARSLKEILSRPIKKVPTLRGKVVCNLFYEPSTRTKRSFELAARYMSAD